MTQEEKAIAYDEAIQKANNILEGKCKNFFVYNHYNQGLIEYIFPEPAESEDERIRKELLDFCKNRAENFPNDPKYKNISAWIAWLEKQNSNVDNANKEYWRGYREGKQEILDKYAELEKQCEQKPTIEMKSAEESLGIDSETYNKIVDECIYDEQKPANKIESDKKFTPIESALRELICDVDNSYTIEQVRRFLFEYGYKDKILNAAKEEMQKSTEWSEEDEENFKHLMAEIVCLGNSRNSANRLYYDRLIKFIEELKNRAQPKEKWCNKDERMLDRLIAYFEKQVAFTDDDNPRYANWLKSLKNRALPQSKQELSDVDKDILFRIIDDLKILDSVNIIDVEREIDWLKSLRPQPQWKPSDAQMASITCAVRNMKESACYDSELVSLLNDLKNLK